MQSEQTYLCRFAMSLSLYIHKINNLQTESYNVYVGLTIFLTFFSEKTFRAASADFRTWGQRLRPSIEIIC